MPGHLKKTFAGWFKYMSWNESQDWGIYGSTKQQRFIV